MHIFHKWGKWEAWLAHFTNPLIGSSYDGLVQVRHCDICGKMQKKRI